MATNANEILDRLAALLDAATPGLDCPGVAGSMVAWIVELASGVEFIASIAVSPAASTAKPTSRGLGGSSIPTMQDAIVSCGVSAGKSETLATTPDERGSGDRAARSKPGPSMPSASNGSGLDPSPLLSCEVSPSKAVGDVQLAGRSFACDALHRTLADSITSSLGCAVENTGLRILSFAAVDATPSKLAASAIRNAAPALIRLARLALEIHPDHLCHVGTRDRGHAIKALGEVRL